MAELFHDRDAGAIDGGGGPFCVFRRAGKIILTDEQIQRAYFSIDLLDPPAQIAIDPVEIEVALEDTWAALLVGP